MKIVAVFFASVLSMTVAQAAFAGCTEDIRVDSFTVEADPAQECLGFEVVGSECVGTADLIITNNCEEEIGYRQETAQPGENLNIQVFREGQTTQEAFTITLGFDDVIVDVEFESTVTKDYDEEDGCTSASGTGFASLFLLGVVGLLRRRKRA